MEAQEVRRLFQECQETKVGTVAKRHGLTHQALLGMFFEYRLLGNELDDPSPDEIAKEMETLRSSWDAATERSRWMAARTISPIGR